MAENLIKRGDGPVPGRPLGLAAQQIFFRHHFQDGADILGHAAVHQHERLLQSGARRGRHAVETQQRVPGQQAAAAEAVLDVARPGGHAFDELDARPEAARVLPAAAGAAEPLAEDRPGRDHPALSLLRWTAERFDLPGRPHARADQRTEQVGGDGQPRALGNAVDAADQFKAATRAENDAEQIPELGSGALNPRRHQSGGDDGCLEQPKVIAPEIEHLVERVHLGGRFEVDAGQPDDRFIDHAEVRFDRRPRAGVPAVHAQVDGNVEDPCALGKIHPKEENVAPTAMGQVHAHWGALAQDGVGGVAASRAQQFGPDAQRLVERMAEAEDPRIAARGAHGVADLVGESLEAQGVIGGRERAGKGLVGALRGLGAQEPADRLLEAAFEHPPETVVRHAARAGELAPGRQVVAVDRREKEQGADAAVEVGFPASVSIELGAGGEQFSDRPARAPALDRKVAHFRRRCLDDFGDAQAHGNSLVIGGEIRFRSFQGFRTAAVLYRRISGRRVAPEELHVVTPAAARSAALARPKGRLPNVELGLEQLAVVGENGAWLRPG